MNTIYGVRMDVDIDLDDCWDDIVDNVGADDLVEALKGKDAEDIPIDELLSFVTDEQLKEEAVRREIIRDEENDEQVNEEGDADIDPLQIFYDCAFALMHESNLEKRRDMLGILVGFDKDDIKSARCLLTAFLSLA